MQGSYDALRSLMNVPRYPLLTLKNDISAVVLSQDMTIYLINGRGLFEYRHGIFSADP